MDINDDIKKLYPDKKVNTPPPYLGYTHITKEEITKAQDRATSGSHAARILGVSYLTYMKYCDKFGLPRIRPDFKYRPREKDRATVARIQEVLDGTITYTVQHLKRHLMSGKFYDCRCSNCGYNERRVTDNVMPILIDYVDNDKSNLKWDNLRILCYNCYFILVGNIVGRKQRKKDKKLDISEIDLSLL
jgi:hypothetical protein